MSAHDSAADGLALSAAYASDAAGFTTMLDALDRAEMRAAVIALCGLIDLAEQTGGDEAIPRARGALREAIRANAEHDSP